MSFQSIQLPQNFVFLGFFSPSQVNFSHLLFLSFFLQLCTLYLNKQAFNKIQIIFNQKLILLLYTCFYKHIRQTTTYLFIPNAFYIIQSKTNSFYSSNVLFFFKWSTYRTRFSVASFIKYTLAKNKCSTSRTFKHLQF